MSSSHNGQDDLQKWLGFTQKIYSTLDVENGACIVLDLAMQLTGMQRGFISLYNANGELQFRCGRNAAREMLSRNDFALATTTVDACLRQNAGIYDSGDSKVTRLCVPLFSYRPANEARKSVGILYCETEDRSQLDKLEREALESIAMQAGQALENALLYESATRDQQTGLYQRHYFDSAAVVEWRRTVRHQHPVSLLLAQIDDLREFRDIYGADPGVKAVQKFADFLRQACRTEDLISRYSEEQFAILLPETTQAGAKKVASRIQQQMHSSFDVDPEPILTSSIGIAGYPRCAVTTVQELFQLASIALKQAQSAGKNRAVVYEPALSQAHTRLF